MTVNEALIKHCNSIQRKKMSNHDFITFYKLKPLILELKKYYGTLELTDVLLEGIKANYSNEVIMNVLKEYL